MSRADIDGETKPGTTTQENAELRETGRLIRLLEQENKAHCSMPTMTIPSSATASWPTKHVAPGCL